MVVPHAHNDVRLELDGAVAPPFEMRRPRGEDLELLGDFGGFQAQSHPLHRRRALQRPEVGYYAIKSTKSTIIPPSRLLRRVLVRAVDFKMDLALARHAERVLGHAAGLAEGAGDLWGWWGERHSLACCCCCNRASFCCCRMTCCAMQQCNYYFASRQLLSVSRCSKW